MSSSLPYLAVSVALFLATSILLFVYLRRRVDPWLALLAAGIVLFLGPAFDDLIWGFQMGFNGSLACGLGALLRSSGAIAAGTGGRAIAERGGDLLEP